MKSKTKFIVLLVVILFSACTSQLPVLTQQPSITPWKLPPTWTPDTRTFTPSPTSIIVFTHTPTLTPTSTPKTIISTASPTETPYYLKADFPDACQEEYSNNWTLISPNGNSLAEYCYSKGGLQISNKAGTKTLLVPFKKFYNDPEFPDLSGSMRPVHWTNDSAYIYFTVTPEQWMDGGYLSISELAPHLYRMNASNGEISDVLSGIFYHSFSPTDRRLIEIQEFESPTKLIIHDLKTGIAQTITPSGNLKYSQAGGVVWSPDGLKFIFVAALGGEFGDDVSEPIIQSLFLVDLNDLSQKIIVSETPNFITATSWNENDLITYEIMNYEDRYNITTYTLNYQTQTTTTQPTAIP